MSRRGRRVCGEILSLVVGSCRIVVGAALGRMTKRSASSQGSIRARVMSKINIALSNKTPRSNKSGRTLSTTRLPQKIIIIIRNRPSCVPTCRIKLEMLAVGRCRMGRISRFRGWGQVATPSTKMPLPQK